MSIFGISLQTSPHPRLPCNWISCCPDSCRTVPPMPNKLVKVEQSILRAVDKHGLGPGQMLLAERDSLSNFHVYCMYISHSHRYIFNVSLNRRHPSTVSLRVPRTISPDIAQDCHLPFLIQWCNGRWNIQNYDIPVIYYGKCKRYSMVYYIYTMENDIVSLIYTGYNWIYYGKCKRRL